MQKVQGWELPVLEKTQQLHGREKERAIFRIKYLHLPTGV
jgi:hypothetical protein